MLVPRLQPFQESVFEQTNAQAEAYDAINLGQGAPDFSGPQAMLEIAQNEIAAGNNQYAPGRGMQVLREAIAHQRQVPVDDVIVTVGAAEGISASCLALLDAEDEVILLEPYFDQYASSIALAGASRVAVPLRRVGDTWDIDVPAIAAAITPRTKMLILNTPHNPTGSVFSREGLEELAEVVAAHDLVVLCDEVYENIVFDGTHVRFAELPGMYEHTITVSSAAKSFNSTGWKTGWAVGPARLIDPVVTAKQTMSFVGCTPVQPAVAHALNHEHTWLAALVAQLQHCRDVLQSALVDAGFRVFATPATYYVVADISPLGFTDAKEFCLRLPEIAGVGAIPVSAFVDDPSGWDTLVRFAFCKQPEVIDEAARRIRRAFAEK